LRRFRSSASQGRTAVAHFCAARPERFARQDKTEILMLAHQDDHWQ
jgi:hypothetical protein